MESKQLILVAIKGLLARPVYGPNIAQIIQAKKKEFSSQPQWKGYRFQIRTPEGFKHIKILANG